MVTGKKLNNEKACLNAVIEQTAQNISRYTRNPADFTRNRKLDAATTIKVTLNFAGGSINKELLDAYPDNSKRMTASAYEQAKGKLVPGVFEDVFHGFNRTKENHKLFKDRYRLFAIDGSDFTTPYNPDSEFVVNTQNGRPKKDGSETKPYCQVHANLMFDLLDHTYEDCILQPKPQADERGAALDMLNRYNAEEPYIVIMDRGYDGFNMMENLNRLENCFYVIRTKTGNGGIGEIAALPDEEYDADMEFAVTTSQRYYITHRDKEPLHLINHHQKQYKAVRSKNTRNRRWDFSWLCKVKCRVVKFRINNPDTGKDEWEVLLTNLNRFEFPLSCMKELYHMRWDIETSFSKLKYAVGSMHFHSKKDDFIRMELFAQLTMFNLTSRIMAQVHVPQTKHKYPYAIDFSMSCAVVRKFFRLHCTEPYENIHTEMQMYVHVIREGRHDKRNLKPKSAICFVYRVA